MEKGAMSTTTTRSPNFIARVTGFLYLLLIPLGLFGILYVPSFIIVPGDMAATASNITANELLFRLSIVGAILVQLVNIAVVILLYCLLKSVNKYVAGLMVIFLLLGIPIAYLNELSKFGVLLLLNGTEYASIFTPDQSLALAALFLDLHQHGIMIAQVFWGLWLIPMGYLVYRSGFLPRVLGILLVIGGLGYLTDSFIFFLSPSFGFEFTTFTFIGEALFPLWLLIKGVNREKWEERATEPR
jgi:hypothetical protein